MKHDANTSFIDVKINQECYSDSETMTKEELYKYIEENVIFGDSIQERVLFAKMDEFFSDKVIITIPMKIKK